MPPKVTSAEEETFAIVALAPPVALQRSGPRITERSLLKINSYCEFPEISRGGKNLALVIGIDSHDAGICPKYSSKFPTLSILIALDGDSMSPMTTISELETISTEARHFQVPLELLKFNLSIVNTYSAPGTYGAGFVHL